MEICSDHARVDLENLENTCLDCADFLANVEVECENCPVFRLKERLRSGGNKI